MAAPFRRHLAGALLAKALRAPDQGARHHKVGLRRDPQGPLRVPYRKGCRGNPRAAQREPPDKAAGVSSPVAAVSTKRLLTDFRARSPRLSGETSGLTSEDRDNLNSVADWTVPALEQKCNQKSMVPSVREWVTPAMDDVRGYLLRVLDRAYRSNEPDRDSLIATAQGLLERVNALSLPPP